MLTSSDNNLDQLNTETEILVIRAKNGNAKAFGQIYRRFVQKVYRFIYFKVGSIDVAQDLSQEVFLKAWENIDSVNDGTFQAWLFTIARNKVIDHYRQKRGNCSYDENFVESGKEGGELEKLHDKIEAEKVKTLLKYLKPQYRDLIILRTMQGLSVKEVAAVLNISQVNVRVKTHRALVKLKQLYER